MTKKMSRCLICFWEGYLGIAPSVVNMARGFSEHGVLADTITRNLDDGPIILLNEIFASLKLERFFLTA
jgi:hypothetical protein